MLRFTIWVAQSHGISWTNFNFFAHVWAWRLEWSWLFDRRKISAWLCPIWIDFHLLGLVVIGIFIVESALTLPILINLCFKNLVRSGIFFPWHFTFFIFSLLASSCSSLKFLFKFKLLIYLLGFEVQLVNFTITLNLQVFSFRIKANLLFFIFFIDGNFTLTHANP